MDAVVEDAVRAVAQAEAARVAAEAALHEAWAERVRAVTSVGWRVVYIHVTHGTPPSQALVVEDGAGGTIDIDQLAAEAVA
jgi:hypothetical protein